MLRLLQFCGCHMMKTLPKPYPRELSAFAKETAFTTKTGYKQSDSNFNCENVKYQTAVNIAKLSASPSYHHCFHQHQYQQLLSHIWTPGNLDRCLEMAKIAPSHTYNIYWHSWFGPILNNFERLEVSFAESSLPIVWLSASEASALFKPERSYLITKLKFLLPR